MSYENPPVPHEVNVGREKPLIEFLRLAGGLGIFVLVIAAILYFAGGTLARKIPFSAERSWVGDRVVGLAAAESKSTEAIAIRDDLQKLTDELAATMELPKGMTLTAHYLDTQVPNAFASLGGHLAVTRGLYARMPSENALALVLAHEIAHVKARDPIAALGGSAAMLVVLAVATGNTNNLAGAFASVVQRGYSRRAEAAADEAAIAALRKRYGHAGGGAAVFESLATWRAGHGTELPSLLSTHPLDADRIARLRAAAADWNPALQPLQNLRVPPEATTQR